MITAASPAHCLVCGRPADRALSRSSTAGCQHPGQLPRRALWQERGCAPRRTRENDHLRALGKRLDSHVRFVAQNQARFWIPDLKSDRTSERVYEVPCNPLFSLARTPSPRNRGRVILSAGRVCVGSALRWWLRLFRVFPVCDRESGSVFGFITGDLDLGTSSRSVVPVCNSDL